jgi:uncharacterized repeat protein (TIGR03806 family)
MRSWVREGGGARRLRRARSAGLVAVFAAPFVALGCSSGEDRTELAFPELGDTSAGALPFLGLPATAAERSSSPELLSGTQAFADLGSLETSPGILPYDVQSPLWSDGAQKRRWIALPSGGQIGFSEAGAWAFPPGTVFIKQFDMALDERVPDEVQHLETRFLVAASDGGYYGLVYEWDEDQRDARLLLDGAEETLDIVQHDGSVRQQLYTYPSQQACNACHSAAAGYVLGPRTAQLNREYVYGAGAEGAHNQIAAWAWLDVFDSQVGHIPRSEHERLVPLDDETASVEARVRSYWDSNCSACHSDRSPIPSWDARFSTPLARQGVLFAEPYTGPRPDGAQLIVPGEPERSLIYLRSLSTQPGVRMPPLLRNRVDDRYVALLGQWIESLAE